MEQRRKRITIKSLQVTALSLVRWGLLAPARPALRRKLPKDKRKNLVNMNKNSINNTYRACLSLGPSSRLNAKAFHGFPSHESMDTARWSDHICRFVLGGSPPKLMVLGRHTELLEMAKPVHDDLLFSMELPAVSLLSIRLLDDEYGATVVTL